ncbi:hypothetical protein B0H19DRAFT_1065528 [Mycena capillaripes]|nr:hypothetical protein B0H19DRAFT_1065528 [Mycena capillaripes]
MSTLNITVTDQSPSWIYNPSREGVSSSSWQSSWTGAPDSNYDSTHKTTNVAAGASSHFTTLAGAQVQIDFVGSAVSLYGQGTAGAYSTTLDSGNFITGSPVGSMLATYGGLNATTKHTLVLKAIQPQQLSLSYATFTIRSDMVSNSVTNTTELAVTTGANNALSTNPFFGTSGDGFSNQHSDQGYTRLDTNSANAQISFSCSNAKPITSSSALLIYGTTNYDHQTFSVELTPQAGSSVGGPRILNGTSKWFVIDNLLYFEAGLDPSQKYDVKVVMMNLPKIGDSGSASGSDSKSTSGVGKTVGIAVGVVGLLAALVLFAFCFRRRKAQEKRNTTRMTIDGMATPSGHPPFVDNPHVEGSSVGIETPVRLGNFRAQSEAYPHSSSGDGYPNSEDLNPHGNLRDSTYAGSTVASGSRLSSSHFPATTTQAGSSQPYRKSEKGPIPSDTASARAVRQEVDAGQVPKEEVLPPSYNSTWQSQG